ncbi:bifunctional 3-(3-hydroxy-phenyl)propionate/3-hydroxycinnamic acid hydroxylase [Saccharothrix longispora]|uniref:bifunctional 3-(3-hydroxy-phenyl)propionate/3-hydroxycinnamic acid hydroxylase MhpA n=1 Tax=Saccharothrix longispora TaxID=33920 RepID=UPI0028FD2502|nr:bifunctional 3-(3-hydroxy-phenyl)propionate/3-hydroxycinnamic acid hydroxylase [Saccharothrix longispora]MDU0293580.1 bifunctional 3-(3-hydroxy-phenyl)propionate/3-hydroxycinnamic acid hydroxylase [Saccharothrix longispora]
MYDVVVIGCGPVGALTANLLGARGVRTLVVERGTEPHGQPRAFSCDDEALRIYQQAGLRAEVAEGMYPPSRAEYVNARGRVFAEIALDEVDFGLGAEPLHFFDQPALEAALRRGLDRFPHVTLRTGTELVGLRQQDDRVVATLRHGGRDTEVEARYVLGADGARSTTRTAAGIALTGSSAAEPWLAVSGEVEPGATRVATTRFVCDWRRPAFVSPGAGGTHRLEFMLRDGEDPKAMTDPATVRELVAPYVDPDRFTVTRAVVYTFHTLVADRWRAGRVFLLGDAAHQMPPFLGQGLCSGLRDAANLTWRIAQVLRGDADDALLDGYEAERRPHTEEMTRTSVRLGRVFLVRDRFAAALRDAVLRAAQAVPRVRRAVRHFEFKPRPVLPGHRAPVGTMFPQPDVAVGGTRVPLDDVLGAEFAVVGPGVDAATALGWRGPVSRFVRVVPPGSAAQGDITTVEDVDGALTAWFAEHGTDVVVLRPDRFVHATTVATRTAATGRGYGASSAQV